MENREIKLRTIDYKIAELCDEVDYWKEEAIHWKDKYDKLLKDYSIQSDERLREAKRGVANALTLALCLKDDENGNLVIDSESRKLLAESIKHNEGQHEEIISEY